MGACGFMLLNADTRDMKSVGCYSDFLVFPVQISRDGSLIKLQTLPSLHSCCTIESIMHTMTLTIALINPFIKKKIKIKAF